MTKPSVEVRGRNSLVPLVWDFVQYRDYLDAFVRVKRETRVGFSVRQFCLHAGISTENYLLKVIRGERRLGPKLSESFISALRLNRAEAEYFRCMVSLGLVRKLEEKAQVLDQMATLRRKAKRPAPTLDQSILRHWYLGAIWELASCRDFDLTPQSAVHALGNKISQQQAREAIEYLVRRGYLVEEMRKGALKWVQREAPVITAQGRPDPTLRLLHREMIQAALQEIDTPIEERCFFGLTMAIDHKKLPALTARFKEFMDQIQEELALDAGATGVYRINLHCFPLAKPENVVKAKS